MEASGYKNMAPGMEQVIKAGDTLVLRDNDDNEFALTARESDEALAFFRSFDDWFTAKEKGTFSEAFIAALWFQVRETFNNLPMSIQRELPSFKSGGVILRGHNHAH